ncbi:TetR/AcrR family transcriptional regulator C-terminal domain-containing protein [Arthrobacter sp. HMWF013]|uniref:TetR/AcrR family transcriptional regulator C-terminal domain-containing protein n=1 Tax=Arthrobacter sp. HMWF013 TaxID=2056849 RepID=UPI000D38D72E|nr:TetR/AcrR family transcriptional regulator C-terminal domain-containing protein [Arthrobacter sp. HMWF013]PTT70428.1 TetR family transcriptional regulator [Arthrobacter sp. HMWF013]
MSEPRAASVRVRLSRDRVLQSAVSLADEIGIGELSMRRLAQELEVVPMALYKHVSNKDELLDGMVDVIVREIDPPADEPAWRDVVRRRILSARTVLRRHQWARQVLETRTNKTPGVLAYMDSFIGIFLDRGFSVDLTHHVMHAIGSRMWGFTQELFAEPVDRSGESAPEVDSAVQQAMLQEMSSRYPNVLRIAMASSHDEGGAVGQGCDDQFEFEFALDLLLNGIERLHAEGWTSAATS